MTQRTGPLGGAIDRRRPMTESVTHEGNETPDASDDDVKRVDADTPHAPEGAAVADQGVGANPTDSTDTAENADPKSGGTPVQPAPTADSQEGDGNAEGAAGDDAEGDDS
jgi:hypothetical protein